MSSLRVSLTRYAKIFAVDGEWPLVGRQGELNLLARLLRSRECRGVVVAGPAGVGKTRLATECAAEAEAAGMGAVRVAATRSAAPLPFGALAPFLPAADLPDGLDRPGFLHGCCVAFAERAMGKRLVLFVDDAHLLDESSAALAHLLAETGSAFVLATLRSGAQAPDAMVALWKDGLAERLDLAGLSDELLEHLLDVVLGGPVERATSARLAARCQGNVLFLRELVLGARASGVLVWEGGLWRLSGSLTPSDRLVELVEGRLGDLSKDERSFLEVVALGEPLGTAELRVLSDAAVVESLERQGFVQSRLEGRRLEVRLAHPVYGDVLRDRLAAVRVRAIARALADAVEATGARRRDDILRVATWRLDGGGTAGDELMLLAAQQARTRWALPQAERLARAAIDAGAGFDASLLLGQLYRLQGRAEEAERLLAALVPQAATDSQRAALATTRIDILGLGGRTDDALRVGEEAETTISDLAARDEVAVKRGNTLALIGQTSEALEMVEPMLSRAQGATLVSAHITASFCFSRTGQLAAAIDAAERGYALHVALPGAPLTLAPHLHLCLRQAALASAGRLAEAENLGKADHHRAVAEDSGEGQAMVPTYLAYTLLLRGRVREAARCAREAANRSRELGWTYFVRTALIALAHSLALTGAAEAARVTLAEVDALGLPSTHICGGELLQARAWTKVAGGDLSAARRHLKEAVALTRKGGELVPEAFALYDLARLGQATHVFARLARLAETVEGPLVRAQAAHAAALAHGKAEELEPSSASLESMGFDLLAAEAAADAAVAWWKRGDRRKAAAAERRAWALVARCEGAMTPALRAIGVRATLTPKEQEVALLAAAGRSNKEIAAQLDLSLRTVENNLHRVYEKLGIAGRGELAAALEA